MNVRPEMYLKKTGPIWILLLTAFMCAPPAHAVIILPAIVLIPIIKIVALAIGALTLPAAGLAAAWSRLFGRPLHEAVAKALILLVLTGILIAVCLRVFSPERPLL